MTLPTGIPHHIPFLAALGIRFNAAENGRSEIELGVQPNHQNSWDMAHGGVLMTLLDVAMVNAGRSADPDVRSVLTIEMKTTFMAPGRGKLTARAHCVHRTTAMAFCEGEIVDAAGKLVSRASGTFKFVKAAPLPAHCTDSGEKT